MPKNIKKSKPVNQLSIKVMYPRGFENHDGSIPSPVIYKTKKELLSEYQKGVRIKQKAVSGTIKIDAWEIWAANCKDKNIKKDYDLMRTARMTIRHLEDSLMAEHHLRDVTGTL